MGIESRLRSQFFIHIRRSHTGFTDYDEACKMHLTPGVVHNFPKAVGV